MMLKRGKVLDIFMRFLILHGLDSVIKIKNTFEKQLLTGWVTCFRPFWLIHTVFSIQK